MPNNQYKSPQKTKISLFYLIKKFPFHFLFHYGLAAFSAYGVSRILNYAIKVFSQKDSSALVRQEFWPLLGGLLLYGVVAFFHIALGIYCEEVFSSHLRKKLAQKYLTAKFSQTQKEKFILTRYDSDAQKVGTLASRIYNRSFFSFFSILFTIWGFVEDKELHWVIPWCLGFLVIMALSAALLYWIAYYYHYQKNQRMQKEDKNFKELSDNIEYIKTVGTEKEEIKKNNILLNSNLRKSHSFVLAKSAYATVPSYLLRHGVPLIFISLHQGAKGAVLYFKTKLIFDDMKTIIEMFWAHGGYDTYATSLKQLNRSFAILEKDSDFSTKSFPKTLPAKNPSINFQKVNFTYPKTNKKVLDNFSFTFQNGKKYLIIGPNGVGKSTLFKLIVKLYRPQQGVIKINNSKLEKFDNSILRKKVVYLPNNPSFFNTSLGDNIVYPEVYQENIHKEKLEKIAKKLGIKEFIDKLPNRWETIIAEKGQNLSEGQKQLVSLMRAFIKDYEIYLFDEFLSNINSELKEKIVKFIFRELREKTIIIISHDGEASQYVDEVCKFTPQGFQRKLKEI